jgi:hypothetical protein
MRLSPILAVILMVLTVSAATYDVPRLPAPSHADREVSGDINLSRAAHDSERRFQLELTFTSSISNNVQVAFGRDTVTADGKLAAEETDVILGWDCGTWFLRPSGLQTNYVHTPADGQVARSRTLKAAIRSDAQGVPRSVSFEDDLGALVFDGLALNPAPEWLTPMGWTLLRVTVRGADLADENLFARFLPDGATLIIK